MLAQYAAYETVQATTANPGELVLLLFEGATRFLRQAQAGLARGDAGAFAYPLSRAHAIIALLSNALDREVGGEVAANLGRLYDFMLRHLTEGLARRSASHVAQVLAILDELRDGFEQAVRAAAR